MSSPNKDSEKLIELVAGPVTALFAGGDLRTIRIDECEIIDRMKQVNELKHEPNRF